MQEPAASSRNTVVSFCIVALLPFILFGMRAWKQHQNKRLLDAFAVDDATTVMDLVRRGYRPPINSLVPGSDRPVRYAIQKRAHRCLETLLNNGHPAVSEDLCRPAMDDDPQSVDILLAAHTPPDAILDQQVNLLSELCSYHKTAMVKKLLRAGANPNLVTPGQPLRYLPITGAATSGDTVAIHCLVTAGARLESTIDSPGFYLDQYTPLMSSAASGNLLATRVLLDLGANPDYHTDKGEDAVSVAVQAKHLAIATMIVAARHAR